MFKICLENRIIRRETCYKCYLCHYEIPDNNFDLVLKHLKVDKHKQRFNEIDKAVRDIESEKLSTISETQRRKLVENGVTSDKNPYFFCCHICKCSICGLPNTFEHIKGSLHKKSIAEIIDKKQAKEINNLIDTITNKNKTIVNNENQLTDVKQSNSTNKFEEYIILDKSNLYKCQICNCKITSKANIWQHIQGNHHQATIQTLTTKDVKKVVNESTKQNVTTYSTKQSVETDSEGIFIDIQYCLTCQIFLKNSTILQCHVMLHFHKEFNLPWVSDIVKFRFNKDGESIIKCLLCNMFVSNDQQLYEHFKTSLHTNRLNLFFYIKNDLELDDIDNMQVDNESLGKIKFVPTKHISDASLCTVCDVTMQGKYITGHAEGKRHNTNLLKNLNASIKPNKTESSNTKAPNFYACFICEKSFSNILFLLKHYKEDEHKLKMKCFSMIDKCHYTKYIKFKNEEVIQCTLCKVKVLSCRAAIEHMLGKKHKAEVELFLSKKNKLCMDNNETTKIDEIIECNINAEATSSKKLKKIKEFETSTEELIKLGFSIESLHSTITTESNSVEMDDVLNDLIQLDLNKSQKKQLVLSSRQRKPRTPNTELKKNVSFSKNVSLFGKSFIKLCIHAGEENIYNTDPKKLRLLKLGVNLTFPLDSEQVCLICVHKFPKDKQLLFEHLQDQEHIKNLCEMEVNDKEFEEYPDQFSDLELSKNYMQDESDDWVYCYACETKVNNDNTVINLHIEGSNHVMKSEFWRKVSEEIYQEFYTIFEEMWYYAQVFVCEVCKTKFDFEIDFIMHLEKPKHLENVNKLKLQSTAPEYGMCPVCITYWYGKSDSYNLHCKDKFHKRFAKNGDFMVPNITVTAQDLLSNVDERVHFLINESNKVILEKHKESELLKAIEETVEETYPNAKAYTFGSRLSNLGFSDSDVDVFLDCDNLYNRCTTQEQSQQYLLSVKKNFETNPSIWIVDEILLVTRVPIIKLRHIPTGLKCDISFINGLSVEKSKLIGYYNTAYSICRELILYLKKWLSLCQISGSDCITTFAISWYVIFYLQVKGIVPAVHDLIKLKNQSRIVDGWECGFIENISATYSSLSFKDHLENFFSYYAIFDYKTNVVCPYLGKIIQKRSFAYIDELPEELEIYRSRVKRDDSEMFRFDSPMCIQDPIDLSQNMTKAVKKRQLRCFRQYCIESATKISRDKNSLSI